MAGVLPVCYKLVSRYWLRSFAGIHPIAASECFVVRVKWPTADVSTRHTTGALILEADGVVTDLHMDGHRIAFNRCQAVSFRTALHTSSCHLEVQLIA